MQNRRARDIYQSVKEDTREDGGVMKKQRSECSEQDNTFAWS